MQFPQSNHKSRTPIPHITEPNIKAVEEKLAQINWRVFVRFYIYTIGLLLATVFAFIVVVGLAEKLISLL